MRQTPPRPLHRFKHLRVTAIVLVAAVALLTAWCAPVLNDVWREANDRDPTREGAYWKARGFVREDVKKQQDADVAFQPYSTATVTFAGADATVILPEPCSRRMEPLRSSRGKSRSSTIPPARNGDCRHAELQ